MLIFLELAVGLAVLTLGADLLVRGSVSLAERLHIPHLIVGLTIVAFGTSAPELVVSLDAALEGAGGIAIGNIVGSNIANILIVLGLPSVIRATTCDATGTVRNVAFMVVITVVFIYMCWDGHLSRWDGVVLLALFCGFFIDQYRTIRNHRRDRIESAIEEVSCVPGSIWVAIAFAAVGIVSLPIAAESVVDGAMGISAMFGVSETAIGVTVVALGTSLPELTAATVAALRGHSAMALGNAIGSNIFNILAIMGITAAIAPIAVPAEFFSFELWAMIGAALFLIPFVALCRPIGRTVGTAMTLAYAAVVLTALGSVPSERDPVGGGVIRAELPVLQ